MAKSKIQKELEIVTGVKINKDEDAQGYMARVVSAVADLPEEAWNKLSEAAQGWYNDAAEAVNNKTPITSFDGAESPAEPTVAEEATPTATKKKEKPAKAAKPKKEKPAPAADKKPVKPAKAAKPPKEAKAPKPKKEKRVTAEDAIRIAVCKFPSLAPEQIREKVKAQGINPSDDRLFYVHKITHKVISTLKEVGKL